MADTETHTVSLALYRYLCKNIVGTENHVKTIRLMNTVRDKVKSNKNQTTITSGSFGEGLDMRGSDLDIMYVDKFCEVYADNEILLNPEIIQLRMETDDVKPGFTHLIVNNITKSLLKYCEVLNEKHCLSSTFVKQILLNTDLKIIHGPCLSDEYGLLDQCNSVHCKTWISQASQWISRSNNSWPTYNVKQSIIKHGVLFVPIGVNGSPKEDIEWRISFSVGEKMLISTFTHTQLLCYALLKILLKDVIATYTECSDLLCSFFVKTIIFWISEELPQSVWKPDNLIPCFMRCFNRLIYCVEYSACLHYFIPENNMFENKIEGRAREILLDKLYTLHSYGWQCVLFSDQLSCFHVSLWVDHIEPHKLHTIDVAKTLNSKLLYLSKRMKGCEPEMETYVYKRLIHQIVSCNQSSLQYAYTYYMSLWCARYAQTFLLNSFKSNKHQYKQYKSCLCTLLQNFYHDSVTGWLMLASFFYKTKQYNKALHILVYSITKCTPEKLYSFMDISDIHYQLLKLKSFREKSLVRLWKIMFVDFMKFERNSCLIPNELQMEVENGECVISSIIYAYFLNFLCHYHLNNVRQCQDSIHTLRLVIAENYLIEKFVIRLQAEAYNILGIALQMSGGHEAARQTFIQSFEIYPVHRFNTSLKRLLLMSSV